MFFVIGAQRAGTTRFCHLLNLHPDVAIPTKEPFFFHDPDVMRVKRDWYASLFPQDTSERVYGDGSTYYSMRYRFPGTARRIHDYNTEAHIIYLVRHPLRRIESGWFQLLATREISGLKTFKEAVLTSDQLIEPTLYWQQLSAYREFFRDDQIHIIRFEDFVRDENTVLRSCFEFLGVDPSRATGDNPHDARNESAAKLQPWRAVDVLKTLPGYPHFRQLVPERVRWILGQRLVKPITGRPTWDPELLDYVIDRVGPDSQRLLSHLNLPLSTWRLRAGKHDADFL